MAKHWSLAHLGLLVALVAVPCLGHCQSTSVQLEPTRHLRKGVDAWPLILNPKTETQRRINRHLNDLNHQLESQLKFCDENLADWKKTMTENHIKPDEEGNESFSQTVKVTMEGPALLSLRASGGFFCGAVHPYTFTDVVIFDLRSGGLINPKTWLDSSVKSSIDTDEEQDPAREQPISIPALLPVYQKMAGHNCEGDFPEDQTFLIWPDAKSGKVMLQAYGLPGCCDACEIPVALSMAQARKLGFKESFLQSIEDAHRVALSH